MSVLPFLQFVGSEITGCWFHFCQCLYRNIGQLGLISNYRDNPVIRTWLRSFMALPLVDNDIFPYAIEYLQRNIPIDSEECRKFLRYFEFQWLVSVPRQYWHVGNLNPRSNNWLEGNYCSSLRRIFWVKLMSSHSLTYISFVFYFQDTITALEIDLVTVLLYGSFCIIY